MDDKNLLTTIINEHKNTIGENLFNFLYLDAKFDFKYQNNFIVYVDKFSLKFLNSNSKNYNLLKKTISKITYSNDFNLDIIDKNEMHKNVKESYINSYLNSNKNKENKTSDITGFFDTFALDNLNNEINDLDINISEEQNKYYINEHEKKDTTKESKYKETKLKSNLTFKNFFYSYENKQVINGAKLIISEIDDPQMNPFFIYGASGIGKTHLLNAIGNEIFNIDENRNILYLHSTDFIEEYTSLFKGGLNNTNRIEEFKNKYMSIDVLLMDDIQLLESKEGSLNEFFDIFEKMRNNNKLVVIASDKHPNYINFEQRLITRFLSGLNCEVKTPDTDTKKQIFSHYASLRDITIDEEAITVFIEHSNNVRTLLGYLNAITLSFISNDNYTNKVTKDDAIKILNTTSGKETNLTEKDIISIISDYYKVSEKDIKSKKRDKNIVTSRHFIAYFLRKKLRQKHVKIAYVLGFKDHTAAMNAIKQAEKKSKSKEYIKDFEKLSQIIN